MMSSTFPCSCPYFVCSRVWTHLMSRECANCLELCLAATPLSASTSKTRTLIPGTFWSWTADKNWEGVYSETGHFNEGAYGSDPDDQRTVLLKNIFALHIFDSMHFQSFFTEEATKRHRRIIMPAAVIKYLPKVTKKMTILEALQLPNGSAECCHLGDRPVHFLPACLLHSLWYCTTCQSLLDQFSSMRDATAKPVSRSWPQNLLTKCIHCKLNTSLASSIAYSSLTTFITLRPYLIFGCIV